MTVGCAGAAPNATPAGAAGATRTAEKPREADDGSCNGAIIDANGSRDDAGARLMSPNLPASRHKSTNYWHNSNQHHLFHINYYHYPLG